MRVFRYVAGHSHGLGTTEAYVVRRTNLRSMASDLGDALVTKDYGAALEAARVERSRGEGAWAVIDWVYTCGCRGRG